MAINRKQILGHPSGKIGDLVYRDYRGANTTSIRPKKYKPTKSEKLKAERFVFARRVAFCKFINQSPLLHNVWKYSKSPGSFPYHKIFKHCYRYIKNDYIDDSISVLPDLRYGAGFHDFVLDENSFSYGIKASQDVCNVFLHPYYCVAFIYMYSPVDENAENKEAYVLLEEETTDLILKPNEIVTHNFKVEKSNFDIINMFNKIFVVPAFVAKNAKDKPVWVRNMGYFIKGEKEQLAKPVLDVQNNPKEPYRTFVINLK